MTKMEQLKKIVNDMKPQEAEIWVYYYEAKAIMIILTYNDALVTDLEHGNSFTKIKFQTPNKGKMLNIEQDLKRFGIDVALSSI